jgi:sugar lactone lactonase YvrE
MKTKITLIISINILSFINLLANSAEKTYGTNGKSFYTTRLTDSQAVYLTPENFKVSGNGIDDDADAIQQAIDKVEAQSKFGIVFIPNGKYRLGKKIYIWKGIRLIGYGKNRPVFILGENTPGFQEGSEKYMVQFVSDKPTDGRPIRDANPGTFYSAISNINFEIKDGNPAAICIRSHFAQHCFIAHADFYIGTGKAGIEKVGNESEDCRFFGGEYGIITTKPSPSWPFLLIDSYFEGQRKAAIQTEEGGLTLVRNHFKNVPTAIEINPDRAEELWLADSRFENISNAAIIISDENNARAQINISNLVCIKTPVFASFRMSGKQIQGNGNIYIVKDFCHGLQISDLGQTPEIKTTSDIEPLTAVPALVKSDIPNLPAAETWINLATLGAKGDEKTDDTKALKDAIEKHQTIYLPTGRYRVTEPIVLKPNTVLIGLNPITTQIILADSTEKYLGKGAPVALLEAPVNGTNIVTGIGLDAGGINPRAVACKWMAGSNSYMNDVKFIGGHGSYTADGKSLKIYNSNRTADDNRNRKWDSQYWSLWVTNGGGGTFKDIWTASSFAQAGIYISNTSNEGRLYASSIEHHVRNEVKLKNVSNWKIYDIQMEEESGEGPNCLPLELDNCSNLTIANLYMYRVDRMVSPFPYGVLVRNSNNIEFRGVHVYSPTKYSYDNTLFDETLNIEVRSREIAKLVITGKQPEIKEIANSEYKVEKEIGGFQFIDGTTTDASGNIYFIDSRWHRIYKWNVDSRKLSLISDMPISPMALAFDKAGNLLVTCFKASPNPWIKPHDYTIMALDPTKPEGTLRELPIDSIVNTNVQASIHPGHLWKDEHTFEKTATETYKYFYLAPDGVTIIPKYNDFKRSYTIRTATPGKPFYVADEFGQKTSVFDVNPKGSLTNPKLFAEEGELDVATDSEGNVYVPAGNIFVYNKNGKQIGLIEVPERPTSIVFGGKDNNTLYIAARSALYSVKAK